VSATVSIRTDRYSTSTRRGARSLNVLIVEPCASLVQLTSAVIVAVKRRILKEHVHMMEICRVSISWGFCGITAAVSDH